MENTATDTPMNGSRTIMHFDMDAFFAAVEQRDHPALRGKPVLIGHDGPRGVVSTASYEARRFGCHSAQPMAIAKRRCPQAIVLPVRGQRYREVSRQVFDIAEGLSPLVEPLSLDEAFVDLTGTDRLHGDPMQVAQRFKQQVLQQTQLTVSVGLAENKFLAKLASDMDKPDGLTVIAPGQAMQTLDPLAIGKLWGVGPKTEQKLRRLGIRTVADIREQPAGLLQRQLGRELAEHLTHLAHGQDARPVVPDHQAKSISQEHTFGQDMADREQLRSLLLSQTEHVARRLRRHALFAKTVTVKIRFGEFQTITRSTSLPMHTQATQTLWEQTSALFDRWADQAFAPVRLLGMGAGQLTSQPQTQGDLFAQTDDEKQRRLDAAADAIEKRFGKGVMRRGGG